MLFHHRCEQTAFLFYMITLFNLVVPTYSVRQAILFREMGVVHRIKYSFSYIFLLVVLFTQFIFDIKKGMLYQVKQLNHILLTHQNINFLTLQRGAFKSPFRQKWQFCTFVFYSCKLIFIDFNTYPCCAVMLGWSLKCLVISFLWCDTP